MDLQYCCYYFTSCVSLVAAYHGTGGPLGVDDKRWRPPITDDILNAGRELGYNTIDPNGPEQIGELVHFPCLSNRHISWMVH